MDIEGKIDFFREAESVGALLFGICDEPDESVKTPAYVDLNVENERQWGAVVCNSSGHSVNFTAIDNKIEIRRANGDMAKRCDAMLYNEIYLIFVELKNKRADWIQSAIKQLSSTLEVFSQNYDIMVFRKRFAYICNQKSPHFAYSCKVAMQQFRNSHNVRLIISRDIAVK